MESRKQSLLKICRRNENKDKCWIESWRREDWQRVLGSSRVWIVPTSQQGGLRRITIWRFLILKTKRFYSIRTARIGTFCNCKRYKRGNKQRQVLSLKWIIGIFHWKMWQMKIDSKIWLRIEIAHKVIQNLKERPNLFR